MLELTDPIQPLESRTTLEIVELLATSSTLEAIKCVELCPVESSLLTMIFAMYLLQRSSSNRIIHAKDHASIQINIAEVDPATGRMTETSKMYAICGAIRRMATAQILQATYNHSHQLNSKALSLGKMASRSEELLLALLFKQHRSRRRMHLQPMGESDDCINRLAKKDGVVTK
uniref:Uncharacterized protein n=1 Tax=Timema douglasi TaxID=61478 RepID=A0A7R8VI51_TIMDO|nr:unnamed protein product [Timema douglasi]